MPSDLTTGAPLITNRFNIYFIYTYILDLDLYFLKVCPINLIYFLLAIIYHLPNLIFPTLIKHNAGGVQSKHSRLYTTSALSPHTLPYTNTHTYTMTRVHTLTQHTRCQLNYYGQY